MKNAAILFALLTVLSSACKKTTVVSGIITDGATGLPVAGVEAYLGANELIWPGGLEVKDSITIITAADGAYSASVEAKDVSYIFLRFRKEGYIEPPPLYIDEGDCIEYNRAINPIDATIKLIIENISGATGINYRIAGNKLEGEKISGPNGGYRFSVPVGALAEHFVSVPGGDFIRVAWDTIDINRPKHLDSVFCAHNDTTYFYLKF